jgi:hypothetical protein
LKGLAGYGIGLCNLELGNKEQAKERLTEITGDSKMQHTTAYRMAKLRLATMDDYETKITFAKAPARQPEPQVQPETGGGEEPLQLFPDTNAGQTGETVPESVDIEQ